MGILESKTFKSGNSVAVRLPRGLGIEAGVPVTIERSGADIIVRPVIDPEEGPRRIRRLIAALEAIGPVEEIENREQPEAPDRVGL